MRKKGSDHVSGKFINFFLLSETLNFPETEDISVRMYTITFSVFVFNLPGKLNNVQLGKINFPLVLKGSKGLCVVHLTSSYFLIVLEIVLDCAHRPLETIDGE